MMKNILLDFLKENTNDLRMNWYLKNAKQKMYVPVFLIVIFLALYYKEMCQKAENMYAVQVLPKIH